MPMVCLTEPELRAMLAGGLSSEEEERIAEHLWCCQACEQRADELADDREIRDLLTHQRRRGAEAQECPSLVDLRERLVALARLKDRPEAQERFAEGVRDDPRGGDGADTISGVLAPQQLTPEQVESRQPKLGPYTIARLLGAGTFGVVYLARDERLGRNVALKLPRSTVLNDPNLKHRFLREAEALARLDHPNIVPVFEAGEYDGTCYLAVAFCDGPSLAEWLQARGSPLEPRMAARVALALADAVAHAHARQILHRDIKPGNVLLDRPTAGSELEFTPRLTDFGLAKIAEQPSHATLHGMVFGTPNYMAPEQAAGHLERIGPATDVYALGAVLYELLAGQPPIVGSSQIDTLRRVLIDDPPPLRRKNPTAPEDLEAIVMKCLDKSPARRYGTAEELADDLRRFLAGRPTQARPLAPVERVRRWVHRHPASSALVALAAVAIGLAIGMYGYERKLKDMGAAAAAAKAKSSRLERQVEQSGRHLEDLEYVNDIRTAARHIEEADFSQAAAVLRRYLPAKGHPDRRPLEWHYLWGRTVPEAEAVIDVATDVYQLRLSDDGKQLAAACKDGIVRLYDPTLLALQGHIETGQGEINGVTFNAQGTLLASAGDDGTVKVWQLADRNLAATIQAVPSHAYGAVFLPNGNSLVTFGREASPVQWDWKTGQRLRTLEGHTRDVEAAALSPDGLLLATVSSDELAIVWDAKTLSRLQTLRAHNYRLSSVAFSPDSQLLAIGGLDKFVSLWNPHTGDQVGTAAGLDGVQSLAFSGDGARLFAGDRAGVLRSLWLDGRHSGFVAITPVQNGGEDSWYAHEGKVWSVAMLPGKERFASGGGDGKIRAWGTGQHARRTTQALASDHFIEAALSADGKTLFAIHEEDGRVVALDSGTGTELYDLPALASKFRSLAVIEDRELLAAGTVNGELVFWNRMTRNIESRHKLGQQYRIDGLVYSRPADKVALLYWPDEVWLFDLATKNVVGKLPAEAYHAVAFSPDGARLAVDSLNQIAIFDVATCHRLHRFPAHKTTINSLAWSPDGTLIASASDDRAVKLWSPEGGNVATLSGHRHEVLTVAFSGDGRSVVSGDAVGQLRFTNVNTYQELIALPTGTNCIRQISLFSDDRRIAILDELRNIRVIGQPRGDSRGRNNH
jgi:WD40 repeat protein/serine/threonine protein kinase